MSTKPYNSGSIQSFSGLDAVRKFPSMYIGSTDADGLFLILRELMDNAVDEFTAGRATMLKVHVGKSENWILDDGTGVPQGTKITTVSVNGKDVKSKLPTMQAVFGNLHTSGKHSEAYGASIGVHGVGSKGTNALSTSFEVWSFFSGKWYYVAFAKGKLTTQGVELQSPPVKTPFGRIRKGTLIRYTPDHSIFTAKTFPHSDLQNWAQFTAYLNPGIRVEVSSPAKETQSFYSKRGPADYLDQRLLDLKATKLHDKVFVYNSDISDVIVAFTDNSECDLLGFTSGLANPEGGKHVSSVINALFNSVKIYALKKHKFTLSDFREGLVGLVNARLSGAKFSSQSKVRLTDERMGAAFEKALTAETTLFFKKAPRLARLLCERASKIGALKNQFKASRKVVQELNRVKRQGMPAKYAPYRPGTKLEDRELYLVEGDSSGGTVKNGRFPFQAILPLRGKVMNAGKSGQRVLESEEVIHILGAIGFDPKAEDPYAKLQVSKIICMSDPDPDGYHINVLLLTLFYKFLPRLFDMGMVYVTDTPEFYSELKDGTVVSGKTLSEVQSKLAEAKAPKGTAISHIKGYGEIDVPLVRQLALDPTSRTLIQINKGDKESTSMFERLMNEDVQFRREHLLKIEEA